MTRQEWILLIISIVLGLIFTLCVIGVLIFAFGGFSQSTNDEKTISSTDDIVEPIKDSSAGF